jgi:hypothetical protein
MPTKVPNSRIVLGSLALILASNLFFATSASAEFFGCNDQHSARNSYAHAPSYSRASSYTHEFAAQTRPRITVHPRRIYPSHVARRQCRSWLVKEFRVSGPVIVPQMRCTWE